MGGIGGEASIAANSDGVLVQLVFVAECTEGQSSHMAIGSLTDDIAGFAACGNRFECVITCFNDGDVNGDGFLTPGDAQCAFLIFLNDGVVPENCDHNNFACALQASDVNCDFTTTPGDALSIFSRFLDGLQPEVCFAQAPAKPANLQLCKGVQQIETKLATNEGKK